MYMYIVSSYEIHVHMFLNVALTIEGLQQIHLATCISLL